MIITNGGNNNAVSTINLGIRYSNVAPNGIAKNQPTNVPQNCYGIDDGYPNDPITRF